LGASVFFLCGCAELSQAEVWRLTEEWSDQREEIASTRALFRHANAAVMRAESDIVELRSLIVASGLTLPPTTPAFPTTTPAAAVDLSFEGASPPQHGDFAVDVFCCLLSTSCRRVSRRCDAGGGAGEDDHCAAVAV
jgi:hypothetical protein